VYAAVHLLTKTSTSPDSITYTQEGPPEPCTHTEPRTHTTNSVSRTFGPVRQRHVPRNKLAERVMLMQLLDVRMHECVPYRPRQVARPSNAPCRRVPPLHRTHMLTHIRRYWACTRKGWAWRRGGVGWRARGHAKEHTHAQHTRTRSAQVPSPEGPRGPRLTRGARPLIGHCRPSRQARPPRSPGPELLLEWVRRGRSQTTSCIVLTVSCHRMVPR
jgi:hypothetical protein